MAADMIINLKSITIICIQGANTVPVYKLLIFRRSLIVRLFIYSYIIMIIVHRLVHHICNSVQHSQVHVNDSVDEEIM